MTRERFEALAAAYGGDPARWPADERAAALAWAAGQRRVAEAALAEAGLVDRFLDEARPPIVGAALAARVILAAPAAQAAARRLWLWLTGAGVGFGLAAACAAGVAVGALYGPQLAPQVVEETAATAGTADADITEISGLADDVG